jgi:hypothetical protein
MTVSDHPVVMAVAAYPSKAAADLDFHAVEEAPPGIDIAAALLRKGADGRLTIVRQASSKEQLTRGAALLGGALTVIAAPVGILFLAPRVTTWAAWTTVASIVGHLWHNVPKQDLRQMSDLLEAGQAALVVVAIDKNGDHISHLLTNATTTIVSDCAAADFDDEHPVSIDKANGWN